MRAKLQNSMRKQQYNLSLGEYTIIQSLLVEIDEKYFMLDFLNLQFVFVLNQINK